jgi:hypothetical protein
LFSELLASSTNHRTSVDPLQYTHTRTRTHTQTHTQPTPSVYL